MHRDRRDLVRDHHRVQRQRRRAGRRVCDRRAGAHHVGAVAVMLRRLPHGRPREVGCSRRSRRSSSTPPPSTSSRRRRASRSRRSSSSCIIFVSMLSRALRVTELRVHDVMLDEKAGRVRHGGRGPQCAAHHREPARYGSEGGVRQQAARSARLAPPQSGRSRCSSSRCSSATRRSSAASSRSPASTSAVIACSGVRDRRCPTRSPRCCCNLRDRTRLIPHAYFGWTEGNPIALRLKYLALGEGDTAPVTREVLRQAEPDPHLRPRIHLG